MKKYAIYQKYDSNKAYQMKHELNPHVFLGVYEADLLVHAISQASKDHNIGGMFLTGNVATEEDGQKEAQEKVWTIEDVRYWLGEQSSKISKQTSYADPERRVIARARA